MRGKKQERRQRRNYWESGRHFQHEASASSWAWDLCLSRFLTTSLGRTISAWYGLELAIGVQNTSRSCFRASSARITAQPKNRACGLSLALASPRATAVLGVIRSIRSTEIFLCPVLSRKILRGIGPCSSPGPRCLFAFRAYLSENIPRARSSLGNATLAPGWLSPNPEYPLLCCLQVAQGSS